ncbi:MAG: TIGR03960 family B12-binding radical SAM protein [Vampirovibrionales bacterium]|nr:TIGR03960 family B12-binding radical SAM protein [Vampirovibrionales bacterium]
MMPSTLSDSEALLKQPSATSPFLSQPWPKRTRSPIAVDETMLQTRLLPSVFKPARYMGLEQGAYRKPWAHATARMALAFPDLYEIGISNYGLKLLYSVVNQHPNYLCDRVYAPAKDLKAQLSEHQIPLWGVETLMPLGSFDMVAFSLQYELNYTTIFGLLESSGIPFYRHDRDNTSEPALNQRPDTQDALQWPIIMAGGPGATNPMPLSPFIDAFMIGDGEELLIDVMAVIAEGKQKGWSRTDTLNALSEVDSVYVPDISDKKNRLENQATRPSSSAAVYKRIYDISKQTIDIAPLIPAVQAVHDRAVVEARRGCDRMCRFCQPGFINLPAREQNVDEIAQKALKELEKTGYEECSLLSLSIADYSDLKPLILGVSEALKTKNASLSLPSQRADRFNLEVAEAVQTVRKSTLTFAPEAGTPRLRDVINKNLTDADIERAVTTAYKAGWQKVKLYFMIGLPTETDADLDGIVSMVKRLQSLCHDIGVQRGERRPKRLEINITLSNFVPKPHTPFQWHPQASLQTLQEKIQYLRERLRGIKGVKTNTTTPIISKLEAVIGRGDARLGPVLLEAYRRGAYLDAWEDLANFEALTSALEEAGYNADEVSSTWYIHPDEPLPWDVIDVGLSKSWLKSEYQKALAAASTEACFDACNTCGVCATFGVQPIFSEASAHKKTLDNVPKANFTDADTIANRHQAPFNHLSKTQLPVDVVQKLRFTLEKRGKLRFLSHLDWLRMIYRAVAQSGLPLAYTQGFNPKPKISVGSPLPLFWDGFSEYLDVCLSQSVDPSPDWRHWLNALNKSLPTDGQAYAVDALAPTAPSIDKQTRQVNYLLRPPADFDAATQAALKDWVAQWHDGSEPLMFLPLVDNETSSEEKSVPVNLRPFIAQMSWVQEGLQLSIHKPKVQDPLPIWAKPQWVLSSLLERHSEQPSSDALNWRISRLGMVLQ